MNQNLKEKSKRQLKIMDKSYHYYNITMLQDEGYDIKHLPYSVKILLEAVLRQWDGTVITEKHIKDLANWIKSKKQGGEIPFKPSRVILQDFTGVPAVVDLASMRKAMADLNNMKEQGEKSGNKAAMLINPEVPVDLVIDHSVQIDYYGSLSSFDENVKLEFGRNMERYRFLNWAKGVFHDLNVVPPATGIVHQVNLEYLAKVVTVKEEKSEKVLYPDTLVGTDSHTTMINGLGVLGWGVGGIEAEAGMLGQPSYLPIPEVIGVRLTGQLPIGATATDLALKVTSLLRERGVVNKFVEFFGDGVKSLPLADRTTIANMAPEYGATCGFFPVDYETLNYLRLTGRTEEQIQIVETYLKENQMFQYYEEEPIYTEILELDLSTITTYLSGPKRPQDLIPLTNMKEEFEKTITAPIGNHGHGLEKEEFKKEANITVRGQEKTTLKTGSVVIASITSCTNTSNPNVMLGAGLLAKKAVEHGLTVPAHVKTSLAPGSKVVTSYLKSSGLLPYLEKLGFHVVGYGCATCIGNSGPLLPEIENAITKNDLLASSVLSGNRNFEGRIHPLVKANYLASPILVVAYALAGSIHIDMLQEPLGMDQEGNKIFLKDIWPSTEEIGQILHENVKPELFHKEYEKVYDDNLMWNEIKTGNSPLYDFDEKSTYIQNPPFFMNLSADIDDVKPLENLSVIAKFQDSITTDHISPAGVIGKNTPAGKYLLNNGVDIKDFNTYGSRRGNHEVMMRGTFANIRIRNQIAPGTEGGYTTYWTTKEVMPIYDACMKYKKDNTGLVVLAGKDYGMGSSRDWAAKGTSLLGIKAVIAQSYERIHRSNLVMMGVLPLQFNVNESAESLGLTGEETISILLSDTVKPHDTIKVIAKKADGGKIEFNTIVRFDSVVDVDYYRHGGILQMVLRDKIQTLNEIS